MPGNQGRTVFSNLISNPFGGAVHPITSQSSTVLGHKTYPNMAAVPEPIDLAVIATLAVEVAGVIAECSAAGVKGAVILSGSLGEHGQERLKIEQGLVAAQRGSLRILGPDSLGIISPLTGLNASLAAGMPRPGNVAFISQSGALCTAVLDWSLGAMVGFSSFISVGSMLDVGWGDLIDYLGEDSKTHGILIYMESIGDAHSFLSAAREVALAKPIIVIKAGRTKPAARAAASHTGALTGNDEVLDAAFRRCGVLRVNHLEALFDMAEVLAKQPRPRGPKLAIVTNSGASGILATDALIHSGGQLAELSPDTMNSLGAELPSDWSHGNPIDLLGDATPELYAKALEIAARETNADGVLVILTPQPFTDPKRTADAVRPFANIYGKPLLASWMGGAEVEAGIAVLNQANIPTFSFPDAAARAFQYMWRYSYNLRGIYETPATNRPDISHRGEATEMIAAIRRTGRTLLTELESKQLLAAYDIPVLETRVAASPAEAVRAAQEIGYPVVLKVYSETIIHKALAGGVELALRDAASVRRAFRNIQKSIMGRGREEDFLGVTVQPMAKPDAYEIIIGCTLDAQFGPVLLFGSGGTLAEVYADRALALPPLNSTLARRMMEQTRIYVALDGRYGGRRVDLSALEALLVRFSDLVVEQPWIREADINPLMISDSMLAVADARVSLHGLEVAEDCVPSLAIRPYPMQYVSPWTLKDGTPVLIRPIKPEDEPLMARFHETISDRSVYFRYFHPLRLARRVAHERLARICFIDYAREMALVASRKDASEADEIIGVGRLVRLRGTRTGEFAILIADRYHHKGLGKELLRRLIEIGRREGLERIIADILPDNRDMLRIADKVGFRREYSPEAGVVRAEIML